MSLLQRSLEHGRFLLDAYQRRPPFLRRVLSGGPAPSFRALSATYPEATIDLIEPSREYPVPRAASLPLRPDARHLARRLYRPPDDIVARLREATYCSFHHVVIDRDRQIVRESCNAGKLRYFRLRQLYDDPVGRISGPVTPWKLRFFNYYHLLVEALPRLLALERSSMVSSLRDVQLLCPGGLSDTDRFFLAKLGLDRVPVLEVAEGPLYTVEDLLLSSLKTQLQSGFLPPWYVETLRAHLLPTRPSTRSRRLYISRERAWRRRVQNHAAVVALLRDYGFEPIVMEELSPQEQIEAVYDAEAVVSPHGAGLTNMLFGRDLRVLEVFPSRDIAPHYYFLAAALGHRYEYLLGPGHTLNPDTFSVDLDALRHGVEQMLRTPMRSGAESDRPALLPEPVQ